MNTDIRQQIETALGDFSGTDLRAASIGLLNSLGYQSEKTLDLDNAPDAFLAEFDKRDRKFRKEKALFERWSVRTLREKISGMLFERTAISKKPEVLVKQEIAALRYEDKLTPDLVFRVPYFLDFLGLKDSYSEKDLETAILREMESFILELGVGFSFVARQKRSMSLEWGSGDANHIDIL